MKRSALTIAIVAILVLASAATAFAAPRATRGGGKTTIQVYAAASLNQVFPKIATAFQKAHKNVNFVFNFNGTDVLTSQIELGAQPDVFAGASTKYADKLFNEGLIKPYRLFATNKLVMVTPASNPAGIKSLKDLTKSGTKIVMGTSTVPIGSYTRTVLTNLNSTYGSTYSTQVLKNVVAQMTDVTQVLNAVMLGEADAGFVYVTDARQGGAKVKIFSIIRSAQANPEYPIAALRGAPHAKLARQFITFVRGPVAQKILRKALFGPYPTY
jgi:molybdate transport system substrate-binding protein